MGIIFIGSQPIGYSCLNEIIKMKIKVDAVFTFKPDPHEKWEKSVDSLAKENSISIYFPEDLTSEKFLELNPDLVLVVGYRKLFPQEILDLPKYGVFGLHASLLPHLRGQAPLNWSIINGDSKTGITMFKMDRGIDTGDIVGQKETAIEKNDTVIEIKKRIENFAIELVRENIPLILENKSTMKKQNEEGTYGCARIPEDGKIDWNKPTQEIFNLIRGSEPTYAAFTFLDSQKLFITEAEIIENEKTYFGTPGQIAMTYKDGTVSIKTGDGVLRIKKVKLNDQEQVDAKKHLFSSKMRLH